MKMKHIALLSIGMTLSSYSQTIAVVSESSRLPEASIYSESSVKILDQAKNDANNGDGGVVIQKQKEGLSQTFNGISSEDSLISVIEESIRNQPSRACEIVKEAISLSKADESLICRVVEAAIFSAPDQLRLISQCAIAAAPDSLTAINAIALIYEEGGDSNSSGKEVSGKEITGKETSGKEVAKAPKKPELEDRPLDVLRIPGPVGAAATARLGLTPKSFPWPQTISPNVTTNTEVNP